MVVEWGRGRFQLNCGRLRILCNSRKESVHMEEYLTTAELSDRIKMAPGTIRNLVCKGQFKMGIHYIKPTSRKLLFIWSEIQSWLHGNNETKETDSSSRERSLIEI